MNPTDLIASPVSRFLEVLGSDAPAPGGGAAAALSGAMGAALVEMTARLTLGRRRYESVETEARELADEAGRQRLALQDYVAQDAAAFAAVSGAYRLPKSSHEEQKARSDAIQTALVEAARVPLETARACAEGLRLCERAVPILNQAVISDVAVGALLLHAGLETAKVNVQVNLVAMSDPDQKEKLREALGVIDRGARERLERIQEIAMGRISA